MTRIDFTTLRRNGARFPIGICAQCRIRCGRIGLCNGACFFLCPFEHRIFFKFRLDIVGQFDIGELQKLDRLQ